jgi:hypothetical protein
LSSKEEEKFDRTLSRKEEEDFDRHHQARREEEEEEEFAPAVQHSEAKHQLASTDLLALSSFSMPPAPFLSSSRAPALLPLLFLFLSPLQAATRAYTTKPKHKTTTKKGVLGSITEEEEACDGKNWGDPTAYNLSRKRRRKNIAQNRSISQFL